MRRLRLTALPFIVALGSCSRQPDTWTAFVYPPGKSLAAEDASKAIYGRYQSFEQCQDASTGALRQLAIQHQSDDFGSYECGVGCRYEKEWDMYVCKETRK
ncbi:hypothetical protein [Stenotrophomonas maltophilia]|uniref:hypothetical protein n=1 Tax=Stenotrophomonas maltophilia TaxID=40324 RepID=UPI00289407F2|nr:hypothetical protein [Stenotrophomonas maltophilia]MDT3502582.1 hypothetical protein [Stenotrophomonas maltophilia]